MEFSYLSNKPVLAAAWDGRHRPPWCSLAWLQMQVERLAEEGGGLAVPGGSDGRYQHEFSNESAYPLTASAGEGEVPSEFVECFEGLGMLAFRQSDLVALLIADAERLLSQGGGSNEVASSPHREIVAVSPALYLIEDRRLPSGAHGGGVLKKVTGKGKGRGRAPEFDAALLNPLWDPRPPPVLPFSLRASLALRWKRDVLVDGVGGQEWEVLSAARFLVRSGFFRQRLEGLAERQAKRWQLARAAIKNWRGKTGKELQNWKIRAVNQGSEKPGGALFNALPFPLLQTRGQSLFEIQATGRGEAVIPLRKILSVRLIRAASHANSSASRRACGGYKSKKKSASYTEPTGISERQWCVHFGPPLPLPTESPALAHEASKGREVLEARTPNPPDDDDDPHPHLHLHDPTSSSCACFRVSFLEERPEVAVLRLFVECPDAPSGVVGLDISVPPSFSILDSTNEEGIEQPDARMIPSERKRARQPQSYGTHSQGKTERASDPEEILRSLGLLC
uniref:Uncharacterized protein n=1 Tax=Chromera velia CCMP2878 TaxID=1169474 RepID=A0A0G4I4H7_9ALVE|eukprot:Cvel_10914.t1-p1 / transcript=Cvel_10914.t1 / gene=Cvel_10914 / organism=Chromera_velia_CCMP2878 / gene_product=hypothetical protein / transcript_product=hypothetical protein / location=Cvel_scaffold670:45556-47814(+) / protein_length=508 / sequence_SO=supercontig / SO=protein_coding / is_pseudo=false